MVVFFRISCFTCVTNKSIDCNLCNRRQSTYHPHGLPVWFGRLAIYKSLGTMLMNR